MNFSWKFNTKVWGAMCHYQMIGGVPFAPTDKKHRYKIRTTTIGTWKRYFWQRASPPSNIKNIMSENEAIPDPLCPSWAISIGYLSVTCAAVLSNFGSAVRNMNAILGFVSKIRDAVLYIKY